MDQAEGVEHADTVEQAEAQAAEPLLQGPGTNPAGASQHGGESSPDFPARSFVYAMGRVERRFPSLTVEKEFAQLSGRAETTGLTDRVALHSVLSERANRYLARQMCWVFAIEGLEILSASARPSGYGSAAGGLASGSQGYRRRRCHRHSGVQGVQIAA